MEGKPVTKEEVITEPLFPGGMKNFYMYLGRSIKFPAEAQENKAQGKVYISLLIGRTGKIERIRIISSPNKSLAGEAVRVIERSPDWIPGTLFGNPASLPSIVIINFTSR
jgi:TonB family protein